MNRIVGCLLGSVALLGSTWLVATGAAARAVDRLDSSAPASLSSGHLPIPVSNVVLDSRPVISEFMASNGTSLSDEDGESPDWIEIHNPSVDSVSLAGWHLTDDPTVPTRWQFPATNLVANGYLVVFASGKARSVSGLPLHANFRLKPSDCFVGLVAPDGRTVVSSHRTVFPAGREDISYGSARRVLVPPLVGRESRGKYLLATFTSPPPGWQGESDGFDDSEVQGWSAASGAVGFDLGIAGSPPVGYWNFDDPGQPGTVRDLSGLSHDGMVRSATYSVDGGGVSGGSGDRAMVFGGPDSGASVIIPAAGDGMFDAAVLRDQITFAAWVFGDDSMPANTTLFYASEHPDGSGVRCAQAHAPWGNRAIYWDTGGLPGTSDLEKNRIYIAEPEPTRWKGKWNHYAFVKDGPLKQIWQNGQLLLEGYNSDPLYPISGFAIGVGESQQLFSYSGRIDDFAVWDSALGADQILELAMGASPLGIQDLGRFILTDLSQEMPGRGTSVFLRYPFTMGDTAAVEVLLLRLRYKDGFVAYLNGQEVARDNAPATLDGLSAALAPRPVAMSVVAREFDLSRFVRLLRPGKNLLAIHGLSAGLDEAAFLVETELLAGSVAGDRLFSNATPGQPNGDIERSFSGFVNPVTFAPKEHFFFTPTEIQLTNSTPGATLIYTLNGSLPSQTNGVIVTALRSDLGPVTTITVSETTLLRAAAFKEGFLSSACATFSCLFPARVVAQQRPNSVPATWPDDTAMDPSTSYPADFEIDPRVAEAAAPGYGLTDALLALPTVSLVLPHGDLYGAQSGIYPNAVQRGTEWERAASIEMILPDGKRAFQTDAGIRIHGNISRCKYFTPKHSFDVMFQRPFGPPKLEYPLFEDSPVRSFDRLILRADSIDTWNCFEGTPGNGEPYPRWTREGATYMRDEWMRATQRALGHPAAHDRYVHLYLNGLYWGLYDLAERPDESFAAAYMGGRKEEYDVLADFAEVRSGDANAWNEMMALAAGGLAANSAYFRLLGCNADGSRNQAYPVYLDVTNLVDYCLLHVFAGADDWPDHNWWAARRRGPASEGFRFFTWDQEITINSLLRSRTSWPPFPHFEEVSTSGTPGFLFDRLKANGGFRLLFADRVQRHLLAGALRPEDNVIRWDDLASRIDVAIVAESARWGDYRRPNRPFLREVEWLAEQKWMHEVFWPSNHDVALLRFRRVGLYPESAPPEFSLPGGTIDDDILLTVSIAVPGSEVFYTLDGSDPRLVSGQPSPQSHRYTGEIHLVPPVRVLARTRSSGAWSPLASATFQSTKALSQLALTEIHYHPRSEGEIDGGELEFIELQNQGTNALDLSGVEIVGGIGFAFRADDCLQPGQFLVLARNPTALATRYAGLRVFGAFQGKLDNSGDLIAMTHPVAGRLFEVSYSDRSPWPVEADGSGDSLQLVKAQADGADPASWAAADPTPGERTSDNYLDSDGDGIDDAWEIAHGLDPLSAADAEVDADQDGTSNRQEFLAGTDPHDPVDRFRITAIRRVTLEASARIEVQFTCQANRRYSLHVSELSPLGPWIRVASLTAQSDAAQTNLFEIAPQLEQARYYRLTIP